MVTIDPTLFTQWMTSLMWPFVRIGAMFMVAPVIGSRSVPLRIRIAVAFAMALLVFPVIPPMPDIDPFSIPGMAITASQVAIGVSMGFMLQLVFNAAVIAGQTIAMTMGLGFASIVDPENGTQVPVLSQFLTIMTTLLFLALDGHLVMIELLVFSFVTLPVTDGLSISMPLIEHVIEFTGHMFAMALLMALPVLTAVLIVNLSMGMVTRAAPQLNIFVIGFPITILVGIVVLMLSLNVFQVQLTALFADAFDVTRAATGM
ncbi:MAG: flagellar biosynthetic protein FliR [Pseudomonadota bacterium]